MDCPKSAISLLMISVFLVAQVPASSAEWVAIGSAPGSSGTYDVVIQATYNNNTGTFPLQIAVASAYNYTSQNLTVEPVYPFTRTQPIVLRYDIQVNGSKNFTMVENNITVYYVSDQTVIGSEPAQLVQAQDTYWYANVTVPFKGDYEAAVSIILQKNGIYYGGQFMSQFTSSEASPNLYISPSVSPRILTPAETLDVSLEATFEGVALGGLDLFKANLYGTLKDLVWDSGTGLYDAEFTAPTEEGIYLLSAYAEDQDYLTQMKVYVAEIAKAKSARCPAAMNISGGCTDMKDVRKCISDWKADLIEVSEDQLISCFESATGGLVYGSVICDPTWRGDLDGDEELDLDDLDLFENTILPLSQSVRDDYLECADYDLDGDVDNDDLTCLTNVVSGKWFGGFNGGVCFDAEYDTALACDLNGDEFITEDDKTVLQDLIAAADNGVEMPEEVLETCDFDQNGQINIADENCITRFVGMDLGNPKSLLGGGQTIPSSCMNVYHLGNCQSIRGDLNGDIIIDAIDEILIMMVEADQVTGYSMGCADVNKDERITTEDVTCVKAYTAGKREDYFTCLNCDENIPAAYLNTYEICGDGYDNDCDGLVDRTATSAGDLCLCTDQTPCWMVKDADGGSTAGVGDGKIKVCRKTSWGSTSAGTEETTTVNISGYSWVSPSSLTCDSSKQCKSMECKDTEYHCAYDGANWNWYDDPADLPVETNDGAAVPKLCGDTFDNDCSCGDQECRVAKTGNMFGSSSFWIGAAVGLTVGWLTAGTALPVVMSLMSTGGSLLTDDPETQAALTGFGLGLAVGSFAGQSESLGQASTTTDSGRYGAGSLYTEGLNPTNTWEWLTMGGAEGSVGALVAGQGGAAVAGAAAIGGYMHASKNYAEEKAEWDERINKSCSE